MHLILVLKTTVFYRICAAEPYCFLVIHATTLSDNPLCLKKTLLEGILKLIMTSDDMIIEEKLQYDVNKEVTKISALSSEKIHQYKNLLGEKILRSNQTQIIIKQAKFAYSPLEKLDKQTEKPLINDLIRVKLKQIVSFQDIIKAHNLHYG